MLVHRVCLQSEPGNNARVLTNDNPLLWIMDMLFFILSAHEKKKRYNPHTSNKHQDHDDNLTRDGQFRRKPHCKTICSECRSDFKNDHDEIFLFSNAENNRRGKANEECHQRHH